MAEKINTIKVGNSQYEIDLKSTATPSIASLTTSNNVTVGRNLIVKGNAQFKTVPNVNGTNISLEGHTHTKSEITDLPRDIFCIDLLSDKLRTELDLQGGQADLNGNLLTMIYGNITVENYGSDYFGISISLNNGTTEIWFALVNNDTDEINCQSMNGIFDSWVLEDLNELSNYHIEVFNDIDYDQAITSGWYNNIDMARSNFNHFCTIKLSEDHTKWIVEQ